LATKVQLNFRRDDTTSQIFNWVKTKNFGTKNNRKLDI